MCLSVSVPSWMWDSDLQTDVSQAHISIYFLNNLNEVPGKKLKITKWKLNERYST